MQVCNELAREKNTQDTGEKENNYSMVVHVVNQTSFYNKRKASYKTVLYMTLALSNNREFSLSFQSHNFQYHQGSLFVGNEVPS